MISVLVAHRIQTKKILLGTFRENGRYGFELYEETDGGERLLCRSKPEYEYSWGAFFYAEETVKKVRDIDLENYIQLN